MFAEPEAAAQLRAVAQPPGVAPFAEERALASSVGAADPEAATAFARRLLPVVRRVVRGLVGPGSDADDLCQAALVELLQSAGNYAGHGPLEAWARRITIRVSLRTLKRRRRVSTVELDEHHLSDPREPDARLCEHLPRAVDDYLDLLPDNQREALLLRHAMEHTIPEIAALTGAPVPTVKSRVLKAMATIRRHIRRDLNLGPQQKVRPR
jgi:RNA polymerase sigma-70 factor (ECF subfamily)